MAVALVVEHITNMHDEGLAEAAAQQLTGAYTVFEAFLISHIFILVLIHRPILRKFGACRRRSSSGIHRFGA